LIKIKVFLDKYNSDYIIKYNPMSISQPSDIGKLIFKLIIIGE